MAKKIYNATNDHIFKLVFGDEKNKDILIAFLKTVLDIPHEDYDEVTICDPILKSELIKDKIGILDIKIRTKTDKIIDVEMQVARQGFFEERVLFYISKMLSEQMKSGEEYDKIQKVICIAIAAEHILIEENKEFHNKFLLVNKTGNIFTDKIEINTLELMKIPENAKENGLVEWLEFMKIKSEEELNMIATMAEANTELLKAVNIVKNLNINENERKIAERREKFWRDYKSSVKEADIKGFVKGKAEGIQLGEAREKKEIVLKSYAEGLDPTLISRLTGLSLAEIEDIKNQTQ
ncbi:MAG: Rpn family recombination-promoting nuclease/putative transposase [Oscillospiraceae bacterium]|jgi:predicted transposase/invertase (TIGR01784 family)|nr:Rpn family recombination-promoting nuclease/putative transposase [Oscillospiraceae bacterium]